MINYIIKRSNGKVYATIPNNVILGPNQPNSNPVPINLMGRNKVSWGQGTNENFLWLAENFAGEEAPKGTVKGQLWYNYTSGTGQLLMALVDSARQPDPNDPTTDLDWASIPAITIFNTLPESDTSIMGRMVLTNNGDNLMVLMKDKEWREIQTTRPLNKQFDSLLEINYDPNKRYIAFSQQESTKQVSFFNNGGAFSMDENGFGYFINGNGAYNFDANYFYELRIMCRVVEDNNGTIKPVTSEYKTWIFRGSYYTEEEVPRDLTLPYEPVNTIPDPRRIIDLTQIRDVITSSSNMDNFDLNVMINPEDPSIPDGDETTMDGYNNYIARSLNSKKHLGFKIQCTVSDIPQGTDIKTMWSVNLVCTGIPRLGV